MLAHAPTGWLHPVLHRDSLFLRSSLSSSPSALPPTPRTPLSARANYTCANQSTSNEAGPVALSAERVQPLLSSLVGAWVERGPFSAPATHLLCLITRRR